MATNKPRRMPHGFYTWTVKVSIHPTWVADGFDLTEERLRDILANALGWARETELDGAVVKAPDPDQIRAEQSGRTIRGKRPRLCNCCGQWRSNCECPMKGKI